VLTEKYHSCYVTYDGSIPDETNNPPNLTIVFLRWNIDLHNNDRKHGGVRMSNQENIGQEIAKMAYELWEKGGCLPGREIENWLEA